MLGRQTTLHGTRTGYIGIIRDFSPGEIAADILDKPDITRAATDDGKHFEAGLIDYGEMTLTVEFSGTEAGDYNSARDDIGLDQTFTITYPDGSTDVGGGFIAGVGVPSDTENETILANIRIKKSGEWSLTSVTTTTTTSTTTTT